MKQYVQAGRNILTGLKANYPSLIVVYDEKQDSRLFLTFFWPATQTGCKSVRHSVLYIPSQCLFVSVLFLLRVTVY